MNKGLAGEMKMHASVADCLDKNRDLVNKYTRLSMESDVFDTKRLRLAALVAKKEEITTGITVDKVGVFSNCGNLLYKACLKATVWAKDNNNQTLVAVFAITPAGYFRQTYAEKLEKGKAVFTALSNNAADLAAVGLLDTDIAAIADAIKLCQAANIAPGLASIDKKTAKEAAELVVEDIDVSITTMGNLIISEFSDTEPDFVSSYQNNMQINTVGIRHTGISATITDLATGKAIENAVLTIGRLNKTATSNMAGLAEISKMRAGSYHITIAADGYTTQLMDVTVGKGRVIDLAVALVVG